MRRPDFIEPERPTVMAALPFLAVAMLGLASGFLPPYGTHDDTEWVAVIVFAACIAFFVVAVRRTRRTWVDPAPAFLFFAVVAIARDATGGVQSGLGPLVALPLLWLAITGTRWDLVVATVLTGAVYIVPVLLVGAPEYPVSDWRRMVGWIAFGGLVAPVVQRLVRRLARESQALAQAEGRWRLLVEHLPGTQVLLVDDVGRVSLRAGSGSFLDSRDEAPGADLHEFAGRGDAAVVDRLIAEGLQDRVATAEIGSSTSQECQVEVVPLPGSTDDDRLLVVLRDVSAARARERELVTAKERADRLFADAPHGIMLLSTDGHVLRLNQAMRVMLDELPGQAEGRLLSTWSRPGDDLVERHLAEVLESPSRRTESDWVLNSATGLVVYTALSSRMLSEPGSRDVILTNVIDMSERRVYERRLAHLADHDVLTGLVNRRRFDEELSRHMENCRRYGPCGALLVLDLDHFKEVNDVLGHGAGDQLILSVATLIRNGVRSTDVVARLGGDEFAVLLTTGDRTAAELVASSIVQRIREHTATMDGTRRRVTASVGVVPIDSVDDDAADLLALADLTMYDAKDLGRDAHVVLDRQAHKEPRSGARIKWKGRIEAALESDGFSLLLQPILELESGRIRSAEALLRLHDNGEVVLPARFLYIAERTGLMPALDAWVVEEAVGILAQLRRDSPDFKLEVNLSGRTIGDPNIESTIVGALTSRGIDPGALILEVTETAAVADLETARQFAERISAFGCKFALDDFGAGFGSFYYLKHLLFDYVKIDGEFVANAHRSGVDRKILRSIAGIARDLGKQTVAEFVAEPDVLDVVRAEGVDLVQGHLIGEPVSVDEFCSRFLNGRLAL